MVVYDDPRFVYDNANLTYDGTWIAPGLAGGQPSGSGQILAHRTYKNQVYTSTQSPATGQLLQRITYLKTVLGSQPSGSASLAQRLFKPITLTGTQPSGTGQATRRYTYTQDVIGDQTSAQGQLGVRASYKRMLTGDQLSALLGVVTQHVAYKRTLTGAQDPAQGDPNPRRFHLYRVTLTGDQPIVLPWTYDESGITYDQPGIYYDVASPADVTWWVFYLRLLLGEQPAPEGTLSWRWNPYVWAEYHASITDRPESVAYAVAVDADDYQITYDVDEQALHDDVVYRVRGPSVYTRPAPGVKALP